MTVLPNVLPLTKLARRRLLTIRTRIRISIHIRISTRPATDGELQPLMIPWEIKEKERRLDLFMPCIVKKTH